MTLIFLVGLVDDLMHALAGLEVRSAKSLRPASSSARACASSTSAIRSAAGSSRSGCSAIPITLLYIVGFTNVINLIDGLDGLAAGVSAIAAASLLVLAAQGNRLDAAAFAAALIGACVGFLRYNFNPASIFMGDSGALFLGFTLATISLMGVMKSSAAIALAVPLLIIGVPIFDTASAIVRRMHAQATDPGGRQGPHPPPAAWARIQPAADGLHHLRLVDRAGGRRLRRALRAGRR